MTQYLAVKLQKIILTAYFFNINQEKNVIIRPKRYKICFKTGHIALILYEVIILNCYFMTKVQIITFHI